MKPLAAIVCLAPALFAAKAPSPDAQAVIKAVHARTEAFHKALRVHMESGKSLAAFPGNGEAEAEACRARLKQEKRPEMRMALGLAVCAYKAMKPLLAPADAEDLAFLKAVPLDSPLWAIYPQGPLHLTRECKTPAEVAAFLVKVVDQSPVVEVRKATLIDLFYLTHQGGDEAGWKKALARLEREFPKDPQTASAREYAKVRIKVGEPAPAFQVRTLDAPGQVLTLESFKGRYLLIDFWATWCGPCKEMMPTLHKVHAAYKDKGLEMLSVADDKNAEVVQAYRKGPGTPMPWHNVVVVADLKTRKRDNPISEDYGIHQLPTLVLIGPDSRVLADDKALHGDLGAALARFIAPQVDLDAVRKDMDGAMAMAVAAVEAHRKAGKPMNEFKVDQDKVFAALRARGKGATGALRHACLVAELGLVIRMGQDSDIDGPVFKEVPADSPAWALAPDVVPALERTCGEPGKAYMARLREQGLPVVKLQFRLMDAFALLQAGKLAEARSSSDQLLKEFPDDPNVKMLAKLLAAEAKAPLGQPAPPFQVRTLEDAGKSWTLADFKGKYLLVDFWGTWCTWCVKELPETHKVYEAFKGRGLEILSLASDKTPDLVAEFRRKPGMPMPWKHGFLGADRDKPHPAQEAFGVTGFPTLFLIGPDGRILAKTEALRGENLAKTLEKFLPAAP